MKYYLAIDPTFAALLLLPPIIIPRPFNALVVVPFTEDGEITCIMGRVLRVLVVPDDEVAVSTLRGRDVVEIVIRLGVELPIDWLVVVITDAAFARSDPVRLLKAGTVVSWIAGVDTGILVKFVTEEFSLLQKSCKTYNIFIFNALYIYIYMYIYSPCL